VVVRQVVVGAFPRNDGSNDLTLQVDIFNRRLDEPRAPKSGTDRLSAVPQFQSSGARFEQKRCHDEEILTAHERDLDIAVPTQTMLEVTRR